MFTLEVDRTVIGAYNITVIAHIYSGKETMRDTIKAFKALSDETRLRILNLLMIRDCCVCEVMQALDISQTRASRNLKILYDAGFLRLTRDGLWALYSLDREGMKVCLNTMQQAVSQALSSNKVALEDRERLDRAERVGPAAAEKLRS